ncbi:hypothetical protein [Cupriavidus necator]
MNIPNGINRSKMVDFSLGQELASTAAVSAAAMSASLANVLCAVPTPQVTAHSNSEQVLLTLPALSIPESTHHFASKVACLEAGNVPRTADVRAKKIRKDQTRSVCSQSTQGPVLDLGQHGKACIR